MIIHFLNNHLLRLIFYIFILTLPITSKAEDCNLNQIALVPKEIKISVYPEKISKINEAKNTFEITYYLFYEYEIPPTPERDCFFSLPKLPENVFNPQLEIMKSEGDEFLSEYQIYLSENSIGVERKVRSTLVNSFDFKAFPFDSQGFEIHIMGLYSNETLALNSSPIDNDSFLNMAVEGWKKIEVRSTKTKEIWDQEEYDRIIFSIDLSRKSISILFRIILPIVIIILIGWVTLLIPRKEFETIIQLQSATLIALIAFNIIIEEIMTKILK